MAHALLKSTTVVALQHIRERAMTVCPAWAQNSVHLSQQA
jgi:hypothetical protein